MIPTIHVWDIIDMMFLKFIHVVAWISSLFLFIAQYYAIM